MPVTDQERIPGYDLGRPTEADQLGALERVLGPERAEAAWRTAREASSVPATRGEPSPEDLMLICTALAEQEGLVRVIAHSMMIRLRTYSLLRRKLRSPGDAVAPPA